MDAAQWEKVSALFAEVVLLPQAERAAVLEAACADDPDVRRELESLLAADERPGLLDTHADALVTPMASTFRASLEDRGGRFEGRLIGHYKVLERIGGGGMGVVYKAQDTRLDRMVALKFLPPQLSTNAEALRRFFFEARAASALDHPNLCTVYEVGDTLEGQLYIAMAYYEGETLKKKIERGAIPWQEALAYATQMARGLAVAHGHGIVHRDVKPANVFVTTPGIVKVLDFGVAKVADAGEGMTQTGAALGTVAYMSPEQVRGEDVGSPADVWGLGVVLYEMLTGRRPFQGAHEQVVLYAALHHDPTPLRTLQPEVPGYLARIIDRCLAKAPEQRYPDAAALLADLEAHAATPEHRVRPLLWKRSLQAALAALVLLVAGVVLSRGIPGLELVQGALSGSEAEGLPSIAVLPLEDYSQGTRQAYFSDGMTEALIADLAKIQGLRVISRTSVMRFRDTSLTLPEIAAALGVDYVLEGSVLQAGDQVRVTAQLIEADKDEHRWANSYQGPLQDVLSLQQQIALAIAGEIEAALTPQEAARLSQAPEVHPAAYKRYLQGVQRRHGETTAQWEQAIDFFEQAIALDADFAPAHASLAKVYAVVGGMTTHRAIEESERRARQAVARALSLDPDLAEAHLAQGLIREILDWDWKGAEQAFQRAIALQPGHKEAHYEYGLLLLRQGRFEAGLRQMQRAVEQDPLSPLVHEGLARAYLLSGRYDQALTAAETVLQLDPAFAFGRGVKGHTYLRQGQYAAALAELEAEAAQTGFYGYLGNAYAVAGRTEQARQVLAERPLTAWDKALIYAGLGDRAQALHWLEQTYAERYGMLVYLKVEPAFTALYDAPRFQALLQKVGLDD